MNAINFSRELDGNHIKFLYNDAETNMNRRHFVMWSGGTDSTLLLYELLDYYGADKVIAVSYKYPWLLDKKWKTEQKYRNAFKSKMKLRGSKYSAFKHIEIDISHYGFGDGIQPVGDGLPQAVGWLLSIPIYMNNGDYVYDGGIREDDLTLMRSSYLKLFEGIRETLKRDITLREPYIAYNKYEILDKLIRYGLYDVTWFCEIPPEEGSICRSCNPCITHSAALTYLSCASKDPYIKMQAKHYLDQFGKNKEENLDKKEVVDLVEDEKYRGDNVTFTD